METQGTAQTDSFARRSGAFLDWLEEWERALPSARLEEYLRQTGRSPDATAILSVDVINGFCHEGRLASPRVGSIVEPIVRLFPEAHRLGVRHFVLTQDTHDPQAEEFREWGPHCVRGTPESQTVPELARLPFANRYTVMPKNSISSAIGTALDRWLDEHPEVKDLICVGDCTDLCLYQLAMHVKLRSNALGLQYRVTVPADCVQTYDLPVEAAKQLGAMPHDGDLLHRVFLYHMALNGVNVLRSLT